MAPLELILRRFLTLLSLCFAALWLLIACQTDTDPLVEQVEVTVLVTVEQPVQEVEVTVERLATVRVPVEVTREVFIPLPTPTPAPDDVIARGSAEKPIRLVFSPMANDLVIQARGGRLVNFLAETTGLQYDLLIAETHEQALDALCEHPDVSLLFTPALGQVAAEEACGGQPQLVGVENGINWSGAMLVARRDSEFTTASDLDGAVWGTADLGDTESSLFYQAWLQSQGAEPAETVEFDTDAAAMIATVDGEVDFVTATFTPPLLPYNERAWEYGVDDPDIWRQTGNLPFRSGIGFVVVISYVDQGGYQVRDARSAVLDSRPFVFAETEIVDLAPQIPNDAVVFGGAMPLSLAATLRDGLLLLADSAECAQSLCADDLFAWETAEPTDRTAYEPVRFITDTLEWDVADIVAHLDSQP